MKPVTREVTTKEIIGWEATDGTRFNEKEECIKYEASATCVLSKFYQGCVIRERVSCDVFYWGWEDQILSVIKVPTLDILQKVNQYFIVKYVDVVDNVLQLDDVGKEIIIGIADCFVNRFGTIDEMVDNIRKAMGYDQKGEENAQTGDL